MVSPSTVQWIPLCLWTLATEGSAFKKIKCEDDWEEKRKRTASMMALMIVDLLVSLPILKIFSIE
tara:strand:- start:326 stop:520 length:195 start_codon:yes stop_codon:yes gene_type:complete